MFPKKFEKLVKSIEWGQYVTDQVLISYLSGMTLKMVSGVVLILFLVGVRKDYFSEREAAMRSFVETCVEEVGLVWRSIALVTGIERRSPPFKRIGM